MDFLYEMIVGVKLFIDVFLFYDIEIGIGNIIVNEVNEEDWVIVWKKYYYLV